MAIPGIPILTFHAIDDVRNVLSFSPRRFERCLARLSDLGCQTLDLRDAVRTLRQGGPFSSRSIVITFDDGYRSVYEAAFPILQRYQMTATVFVTTGAEPSDRLPSLNGRTRLSWSEMREMQNHGIAFGAHTLTHPDLTRLPSADAEREVCGSKAMIEQTLGVVVETFAYPFGHFDARARAIAQKHFACACTDALGVADARGDPWMLARVDMYYLRAERLWALIPTGALSLYLRARNLPRQFRRAMVWR